MKLTKGSLADPMLWRKVHNPWISEVYHVLKPQVLGRLSLSIDQEISLIEAEAPPQRLRTDVHLTDLGKAAGSAAKPISASATGAIAYAEGVEQWSADSRHYVVLRDLSGGEVVGILEILSPTNKGYYARADYEAFLERRHRLLSGTIAYLEVDAVPVGTRWLPACLGDLQSYFGVAWSSIPEAAGRRFQGWAWNEAGPQAKVPWDLGRYGRLEVDLNLTFREALQAAGFSIES